MRVVLLSGGVGGARLARGLAALEDVELTVVVNVADDDEIYGLWVSPDLDTVVYTMAGVEGPHGWGLADDGLTVMSWLAGFPLDTDFALGDRDLATNLFRTERLRGGERLSAVTADVARAFGLAARVLPVTDQRVATRVRTGDGTWIAFQEYFVSRGHRDEVTDLRFEGAAEAEPAPGVLGAIAAADLIVIAPSNPPLSIWPILAVPEVGRAVAAHGRVVGVSPLIGGKALKGPADRVLVALGYPPGNAGVVEAYDGLMSDFFIDTRDAPDALSIPRIRVHAADLDLRTPEASLGFARHMVERL